MQRNAVRERLLSCFNAEAVKENFDMSRMTSFKTGGKAAFFVMPQSVGELQAVLSALAAARAGGEVEDYMILGNGSNILVRDGGYNGVLVKLGKDFSAISVSGERITAGAGCLMSQVARAALSASLAGFEFASGIPGSIGGAVFMNAGAYDGEMKEIVESVTVVSKDGSRVFNIEGSQMGFSYRHSVLQETGDAAVRVTLHLAPGDSGEIEGRMKELAGRRNSRQPVHLPSAGSFFKRPAGHFAGKLIEEAGLKGLSIGGAQVSPMHAGFIVNKGGATAAEIINLMILVQNTVYEKSGVRLTPEVRIIGED